MDTGLPDIEAIRKRADSQAYATKRTTEDVRVLLAEIDYLQERLTDRGAYLDWLINQVCPNHNIECVEVGCPATPPGWSPSEPRT